MSGTCQHERITNRTQTLTESGNGLKWHDIHTRAAMFVTKIVSALEDGSLGSMKKKGSYFQNWTFWPFVAVAWGKDYSDTEIFFSFVLYYIQICYMLRNEKPIT